jgi:hypothetical protein
MLCRIGTICKNGKCIKDPNYCISDYDCPKIQLLLVYVVLMHAQVLNAQLVINIFMVTAIR